MEQATVEPPATTALATRETASSACSTGKLSVAEIAALAARLDDGMLARLEATAKAPLPALSPCDDDHFAKCMRTLSILPRRGDDEVTAELRFAIFRKKLGAYPNEALSALVSEGLEIFRFFPTIAECVDLIGKVWRRNDEHTRARHLAQRRMRYEIERRFDEIMLALAQGEMDQAAIDALPERTKLIAYERGFLSRAEDGSFRAKPHR